MGRQYRSPRRGGSGSAGQTLPASYLNSASSTLIAIPNYGVTDLSTYAAGDYVMDSPDTGVVKTLVWASSSSAAVVVRLSTGTSVKAGHSAATQITMGLTTCDCYVQLIGLNSTRWAIAAVTIPSTLANVPGSTVASVTIATS